MRGEYYALGTLAANHVALSPLSFLKQAAQVYARRPAVTYGPIIRDWATFATRYSAVAGG